MIYLLKIIMVLIFAASLIPFTLICFLMGLFYWDKYYIQIANIALNAIMEYFLDDHKRYK